MSSSKTAGVWSPPVNNAAIEAESVVEVAQPAQEAGSIPPPAKGREAEVKAFKALVLKEQQFEPKNVDIRIVAGHYHDPRSFEHFQYNIAKCSKKARGHYEDVLKMPSAEFKASLEKGRAEIEASRNSKPKARPKR